MKYFIDTEFFEDGPAKPVQVAWRERRTPRSAFPPAVGNLHNALDDARWTRRLAQKLGVIS